MVLNLGARHLRHIKPLLGKRRVQDLTRAHIEKFLSDVANGKTAKVAEGGEPTWPC